MKNAPLDKVVEFHLMMEMGIDPNDTGAPLKAALYSLFFVAFGAALPIIPYMILDETRAPYGSMILCAVGATVAGLATGTISGANLVKTTVRQVLGIAIAVGLCLLVSIYLISLVEG